MAKKIVVLKRTNYSNYFEVQYLFWLAVPAGQQAFRSDASAESAYKDASSQEVQDIKDGKILEQSGTASFQNGTTAGVIGVALVQKFNTAQTALNNTTDYNFYGTYYDGSSWTVQGA